MKFSLESETVSTNVHRITLLIHREIVCTYFFDIKLCFMLLKSCFYRPFSGHVDVSIIGQ